MIVSKVEVRKGDILILHTGWHRYAQFGEEADEERYIRMHPGPHRDLVPWLLEKEIKIWGLDAVSTDHPMNLPIGRFLGKGQFGQCDRVRVKAEQIFGGAEEVDRLFPELPDHPQRALPAQLHPHREHGRRNRGARATESAPHHWMLSVEIQRR